MKSAKSNIFFTFLFLTFMIFISCSQEIENSDSDGKGSNFSDSKIRLKIATIGTRTSNTDITEKIQSLRIIILSDGFIEYNGKIDFSEEIKSAFDFSYLFEHETVAGNKKFYLIANEESVPEIKFNGLSDFPTGIYEDMSLTEFLNYFPKDKLPSQGTIGATSTGSAKQFEDLMNCVYFKPRYDISNNVIFLPYTACYEEIKTDNDPDITLTKDMFLVPVATKITFNLYNYRREKIEIKKIEFSEINSSNYIFAQLDKTELHKEFEGKFFWWIDWMEKVAEGTHNITDGNYSESDLNGFNMSSGWITSYSIPTDTETDDDYLMPKQIVPSASDNWIVDILKDLDNPPFLRVVQYYPESIKMGKRTVYNSEINDYEEIDTQVYTVKFWAKEIRETEIPIDITESDSFDLDTLYSLFRGTHLVIDVDIYESVVEIYCQIEPWGYNEIPFLGYVQEDD